MALLVYKLIDKRACTCRRLKKSEIFGSAVATVYTDKPEKSHLDHLNEIYFNTVNIFELNIFSWVTVGVKFYVNRQFFIFRIFDHKKNKKSTNVRKLTT